LAVGGVGLFGTKFSESVLSSADVIVGVGSQYEETATTGWSFWSESAKFIQIDIDPLQIGRNFVPDVALVGDAKLVLKQMFKYLKRRVASRRLEDYPRIKALMEAKRQYLESIMPEQSSSDIPIRVPRMLKEIQNAIKKESWIVIDVGVNQAWSSTWPYFHALKEGRFIGPSEYLCMGFGAAGVIGVKLAHPEDQAICITGDGGFQMVGKEMITAVQYDVPVSWFIMNNFSLGWIKWFTKEFHEEKYITVDFEEQPDFVKWAESQKCLGFHVEKPEELSQAIRNALKANQQGTPALVDVVTDPLDVPDGFSTWHHKLLRR